MIAAIVNFFRRLFGLTPKPPAVPTLFGMNAHEATDMDVQRLIAISSESSMCRTRTTDYGDEASLARLRRFGDNLLPTLVVLPMTFSLRYVSTAGTDVQIGNEPDANGMQAEQYGAGFRRIRNSTAFASGIKVVTAGFSNNATQDYITRALLAGAEDADAVCFHVYGDDLPLAMDNRLAAMRAAMKAAGCTKPLWITEIGFPANDPSRQAAQLKWLLGAAPAYGIERLYIYALATDEIADKYGICQHDANRSPRAAYVLVRAAFEAQP